MLDAQWLVQIFAKDTDGDWCIGTGYAIGDGLVLTARHVVIFGKRADSPELKLVWPEQNQHEMPFTDDDIIFKGDAQIFKGDAQIDLALIRCPKETSFNPPKIPLAVINPQPNDSWATRGFPRAGKEGAIRTDLGIPGIVAGRNAHGIIELKSHVKVAIENGWAGLSGAPVFVDKQLVAVITDNYTTLESYLKSVSIADLLKKSDEFCQKVGLTKQAVVDEITRKLHEKIIEEITPFINRNTDISNKLIAALKLDPKATPSAVATHLVTHCEADDAIGELVSVAQRLGSQLARTKKWDNYLNDLEQICGWLLINTVDREWWYHNAQRFEQSVCENVINIQRLNAQEYVEIIISRGLLQRAEYALDANSKAIPAPCSKSMNPMIFDGHSKDASDIQLLSQIYKDLRQWGTAPQSVDVLLDEIKLSAQAYKEREKGKRIVYYLVSEEYLEALKKLDCFETLEQAFKGCLQFICCLPKQPDECQPYGKNQRILLENVAALLRLRNPKR